MKLKFFIIILICVITFQMLLVSEEKIKAGVILSGCGINDGTEIYEAVFTILALEKAKVEIIMMAPNIPQASVANHLIKEEPAEERNTLVESARIARGNIKDIKDIKASELDLLIIPGGIGSITTLSNIMSKGKDATVNEDVARLVNDMHLAKKPIGSMCLASIILANVLHKDNIKITIGKNNEFFGSIISALGAEHVESTSKNIVIDKKNLIVTTPAFMGGSSNVDMAIGIEKMINKILSFIKK